MKKIFPILIVGVLIGAFLVWRRIHQNNFLYAGTVEATYVDISPQVNTTIGSVEVREGDTVKKGQVLVRLTGDDLKLAAAIADRDYHRTIKLHDSGSIPDETFDRIRFKHEDAALRAAWCTIASPLDGTVINRYREPGEMVGPATKLLTLADLSEVWAYIYVPQLALSKIQLNMPVQGLIPELNMKSVDGRISHIRSEAEFTPKNVQTREERTRLVYGIKISFINKDGVLKPGMTVEVKLPE